MLTSLVKMEMKKKKKEANRRAVTRAPVAKFRDKDGSDLLGY
jgi:hypothetical protein